MTRNGSAMVRGTVLRGSVMGTGVTVAVLRHPASRRLAVETFAWLRAVDATFSPFRPDSEISRLDRGALSTEDCCPDVRHVLDQCARLWRHTDGYFDAYATGRLDPSGYVKGWAIQVASQRLAGAGAVNHLVDVGGDVQTRGRPGPGRRWRVGVRHPWQRSAVCWVVTGTDLAVATSGTYERGGHIVNPRTGAPARELCSVTLVGRDMAETDALATAAVARGRDGLRWAGRLSGHAAVVITRDRTLHVSPSLDRQKGWS